MLQNQFRSHFACQTQNKPGSLSCSTTPLKHRRKAQERRHTYLFRQQQAVFLHFYLSTFFARLVEPRHATSASLSPSNPVRPQILRLNYILETVTLSIFSWLGKHLSRGQGIFHYAILSYFVEGAFSSLLNWSRDNGLL